MAVQLYGELLPYGLVGQREVDEVPSNRNAMGQRDALSIPSDGHERRSKRLERELLAHQHGDDKATLDVALEGRVHDSAEARELERIGMAHVGEPDARAATAQRVNTRHACTASGEHIPTGACSESKRAALDNGMVGIKDNLMGKRTRQGNVSIGVAYIRVSTEEQSLGPEAQRAAIESWAARQGVQVTSWHVDRGVSGGSDIADRPALVAALGELRAAGAGVLVVAKRDRLARDVYVAGAIERAVGQSGARVACADGTANGDTPADSFMRSILDAAAAYERALIRARTKAALGAKKARGERAGTVAYGFRLAADGVRVERDDAEQGVLAVVRELRAAGMSQRAVVIALADRGLVSRSGGAFNQTQVARMAAKSA